MAMFTWLPNYHENTPFLSDGHQLSCDDCLEDKSRGLHGCGGHGDSAGPAENPRGRLWSVRGIRGIGFLTARGHRGAGHAAKSHCMQCMYNISVSAPLSL